MKLNKTVKVTPVFTHEGGKAVNVNPYLQLRRSVLACLLWEDSHYEDGISVADRITQLIPQVKPELVAKLAIETRTKGKLRHVPLLLVRELSRLPEGKQFVENTLAEIIQRPDELCEFLKIYWKDGKCPIANSVKRGLAKAFTKFDEYALSKYNQDNEIKLRDVLFLCHAKPLNNAQADLWKRLIDNKLGTPDTWEVELSQSSDKKASWERLLSENLLGGLALLRNLRNFAENGVNKDLIVKAIRNMKSDRVLPYRFIAAARFYPSLENELEQAMIKCVSNYSRLPGNTVLLIDVSGSMNHALSAKSDLSRLDAANGLAILARELCNNVRIFTFSRELVEVPNRRGFALRDAINNSQARRDTFMGDAIAKLNTLGNYDRLIVFSDEQTAQSVPNPLSKLAYMVNVANFKYGVGYRNNWTHIDGFSESIFDFIGEIEGLGV